VSGTASHWEQQRRLAQEVMRRYGAAPQAYFALMPGLSWLFNSDADAVLSYRVEDGVAIVLHDPAGSISGIAQLLAQFSELCRSRCWLPCFLAASPRLLTEHRAAGLRTLKLGEEALIDLPGLSFSGKAWQDVRTALSRLPRESYSAQWYSLSADPDGWRELLDAISGQWLIQQGARRELSFGLGSWEMAQRFAAEQRLILLLDPCGLPAAFVSFVPCYAAGGGWSLDLMRGRVDLPPGSMEFLLATALQQFQAEGAALLSLGLAPLASHSGALPRAASMLLARAQRVAELRLGQQLNPQGLDAFKAKFSPRWEARYLAYRGVKQLGRCLRALLAAQAT
jgi:lysylphosphatidylglycerol synthetase-like protein (DUF2156 family)